MSSYNHAPDAPMDTRFTAFLKTVDLKNIYSQHGEDGLIEAIFERIGAENKWCLECGAADGLFFSNTRRLIDQGWHAILIECDTDDYNVLVNRYGGRHDVDHLNLFLAADPRGASESSIDDVLKFYQAPKDIDLVVLDIDSQEYYILNSMVRFQPRVVIVEYDPDAEPMFIPELRGKGQAGHLAMRYVAEARGYDVIGRTPTNLICVRKDLSHLLMESKCKLSTGDGFIEGSYGELKVKQREMISAHPLPEDNRPDEYDGPLPTTGQKYQIFANGQWQDADGEVQVANDEELEAAKAGKLPVRALTSEKRRVNIALAMSTPRIGYLDCLEQIIDLAYQAGISRFRGQGVFWSHSLSRSIQQALDWRDKKTGVGFDYILTADYDTFATVENLQALAVILGAHPEIGAVVPLQVKRGQFMEVLAGWEGARDLTLQLVPIAQGHFGFTMFRREFFERLAKPWFREKADDDGNWGEKRIDADIGFWSNAKDCKLNIMLAPRIVVGHGDECVVWPRIVNGKVEKVFQHINEWNGSKVAPEGIGVIR